MLRSHNERGNNMPHELSPDETKHVSGGALGGFLPVQPGGISLSKYTLTRKGEAGYVAPSNPYMPTDM